MKFTLKIWRQKGPNAAGKFQTFQIDNIIPEMSFLEMLDVLNERLIKQDIEPVEFDHDCREGICGACGVVINGQAHGPVLATTVCQLHMRSFNDGDQITIEPFRADAFPIIKDLIVNRNAFDRIVQAGGYISINTGPHADANALPIPKDTASDAFDYAACIGCGACVASCPNASASLFTGAKISHMAILPQGGPERSMRAQNMTEQMDREGFGNCSNIGECSATCPKEVPLQVIAQMKREYLRSVFVS